MPKRIQKLKPDTVLKNYWRNNERFADFFNAVLFDGEQIIRPEELKDRDTEESSLLEHGKYAESIQASRDNIKIRKWSTAHGVELVMLGIEHQENIHYAMPIRVMGYDYGVYKKQYDDNAQKYRTSEGMEKDEYLSGMKKYVNDYEVLLVEAARSELALSNVDNVDLFNLLKIILNRSIPKNEARKKAIRYSEEHKTDRAVVMTVAGATNSKIDYDVFGKGDGAMCTLFEEIAKENEIKGIEKGIRGMVSALKELNIPDATIVQKIREKFELSGDEAERFVIKM